MVIKDDRDNWMEQVVKEQSVIKSVIDRNISGFQWRVILLCFAIALFDGFDTQAVAFTAPALLEHFNLKAGALAPILTAGIIGMTIGAMCLGILGDKLGRRKTLLFCVTIFSVSTLLTAFVNHVDQIFILRIIAGLGMGGATPVLLALAAEYSPQKYKGTVTTCVLLALPAGAMIGGLLAAKILPIWGWQGIYLIGGILPLLLLVLLYFALPESLEYLAQSKKSNAKQKIEAVLERMTTKKVTISDQDLALLSPVRTEKMHLSMLFQNGLGRTTIGVWGVYFFNWIAWFMLLSWLPTILKQAGLAPDQAPYASVTVKCGFYFICITAGLFFTKVKYSKNFGFHGRCWLRGRCWFGFTH